MQPQVTAGSIKALFTDRYLGFLGPDNFLKLRSEVLEVYGTQLVNFQKCTADTLNLLCFLINERSPYILIIYVLCSPLLVGAKFPIGTVSTVRAKNV